VLPRTQVSESLTHSLCGSTTLMDTFEELSLSALPLGPLGTGGSRVCALHSLFGETLALWRLEKKV